MAPLVRDASPPGASSTESTASIPVFDNDGPKSRELGMSLDRLRTRVRQEMRGLAQSGQAGRDILHKMEIRFDGMWRLCRKDGAPLSGDCDYWEALLEHLSEQYREIHQISVQDILDTIEPERKNIFGWMQNVDATAGTPPSLHLHDLKHAGLDTVAQPQKRQRDQTTDSVVEPQSKRRRRGGRGGGSIPVQSNEKKQSVIGSVERPSHVQYGQTGFTAKPEPRRRRVSAATRSRGRNMSSVKAVDTTAASDRAGIDDATHQATSSVRDRVTSQLHTANTQGLRRSQRIAARAQAQKHT